MWRRPHPFHTLTTRTVTISLAIAVALVWVCLIVLLLAAQPLSSTNSATTTTTVTTPNTKSTALTSSSLDREVLIVMSTGGGLWNTGVWSGYGPKVSTLAWANQGIVVDKRQCRVPCTVTHDQSMIPKADAVLMEVINHPKFLGARSRNVPFPFPPRKRDNPKLPIFASFHFEPVENFPDLLENAEFMDNFEIQMSPSQSSNIPITMTCPWAKSPKEYLKMPNFAEKKKLIVYFNEHGIVRQYADFVNELITVLDDDIDAFQTRKNREMPPEAADPSKRVDFISQYHFALITEFTSEEDWVESQLSQAILAGAVPLYIGAPNILDHVPSRDSFIDLKDWSSRPARQLATFLKSVSTDAEAYRRYFDWKKKPLPEHYQKRLDDCVFYAECRLCAEVAKRVAAIEKEHKK